MSIFYAGNQDYYNEQYDPEPINLESGAEPYTVSIVSVICDGCGRSFTAVDEGKDGTDRSCFRCQAERAGNLEILY